MSCMPKSSQPNRGSKADTEAGDTIPRSPEAGLPAELFARTVDWQPPSQTSREPDDSGSKSSEPAQAELGSADPQTVSPSTYHVAGEVARGGLGRILRA